MWAVDFVKFFDTIFTTPSRKIRIRPAHLRLSGLVYRGHLPMYGVVSRLQNIIGNG